jgi:hypothetical protein
VVERPAGELKRRVTPHWVPEQSGSHAGLLDESRRHPSRSRFDAIIVPTYRPVSHLDFCIGLALRTRIPLLAVCSKEVHGREVVEVASQVGIEAFAIDLPSANPFGIAFATSSDAELVATSPGWTRDVSMKRNLGLVLARLLGWPRLMYLDDDIRGVAVDDVDAMVAALEDHSVSALIPEHFPDNSVACHAHRLGGGMQDVFASASGIGVRCDRDDLGFFPNIYNEDWFFFSEEAASHKIAKVGVSYQIPYDPYDNPLRAAQEEFGDLLAEGLYARLDINEGISGVDIEYWSSFIETRMAFHERVTTALGQLEDRELAAKATDSVRAARDQLNQITPYLCQKFVDLWRSDLAQWRSYLTKLPRVDSIKDAFEYLGLDLAFSSPSRR